MNSSQKDEIGNDEPRGQVHAPLDQRQLQPVTVAIPSHAHGGATAHSSAATEGDRRVNVKHHSNKSSSSSSTSSVTDEFIWRLSECCQEHHRLCHVGKSSVLHERIIPRECAGALKSIRFILPKLEANLSTSLVPAMCDFYRSVWSGRFCPHAPHLFHLGKMGSDIFPRVLLLLQHLITRKVISTATKLSVAPPPPDSSSIDETLTLKDSGGSHSRNTMDRTCTILDDIVSTIALLLSAVPEPPLQRCIVEDLVTMLFDLHHLHEYQQQQPLQVEPQHPSGPTAAQGPYLKVELHLFRDTQAAAAAAAALDQNALADIEPLTLTLWVGVETQIVHIAVLRILLQLSLHHQTQRLQSIDDAVLMYSKEDLTSLLPIGQRFGQYDFVSVLCDILRSPLPTVGNHSSSTSSVSSSKPASATTTGSSTTGVQRKTRILHVQSRVAACELLSTVLRDWDDLADCRKSEFVPEYMEIAQTVPYACGAAAAHIPTPILDSERPQSRTSDEGDSIEVDAVLLHWFQRYRYRLECLLLQVVAVSSGKRAAPGPTVLGVNRIIVSVMRSPLMDAVERIRCVIPLTQEAEDTEEKEDRLMIDASDTMSSTSNRNLERTILRVLSELLLDVDFDNESMFLPRTVLFRLVELLDDPSLATGALFVLASYWRHYNSGGCALDSPTLLLLQQNTQARKEDTTRLHHKRHADQCFSTDVEDVSTSKRHKTSSTTLNSLDPSDPADCRSHYSPTSSDRYDWVHNLGLFLAKAQESSERFFAASWPDRKRMISDHKSEWVRAARRIAIAIQFLALSNQSVPEILLKTIYNLGHNANEVSNESDFHTSSVFSILLYNCTALLLALGADSMFAPVESSSCLFHDLRQSFRSASVENPSSALLDSYLLLHLSIYTKTSVHSLLPGIVVSVTRQYSTLPTVTRLDFLSPIILNGTNALEFQRNRLLTLRCLTSLDSIALSHETVQCITAVDKDHRDFLVRLLRWQSLVWILSTDNPCHIRQMFSSQDHRHRELTWILKTAFADSNPVVRDFASRNLSAFVRDPRIFSALIANQEQWEAFNQYTYQTSLRLASQNVSAQFFQIVDRLLQDYCYFVFESRLNYTAEIVQQRAGGNPLVSEAIIFVRRRSALCVLLSFVSHCTVTTVLGQLMVEDSLKRAVRLLSASNSQSKFDLIGLGIGELSIACRNRTVDYGWEGIISSCTPIIFREALHSTSSAIHGNDKSAINVIQAAQREQLYLRLSHILQRFYSQPKNKSMLPFESTSHDVLRYLETCLPVVVSNFVVNKDYGSLLLATGFKLYARSRDQTSERLRQRTGFPELSIESLVDVILDGSQSFNRATSTQRSWHCDLEGQTRQLCLAPGFIEQMLPKVLMKAESSELSFFVDVVLHEKISLQTIIIQREQLVLKCLLWEASRTEDSVESGTRALRIAAVSRLEDSVRKVDENDQEAASMVTDWISSQFMYLLVNTIQFKWASRTMEERLQALRCLNIMLQFVKSSESPTYAPQIMATVSAVVALPCLNSCSSSLRMRSEARVLAIKALHHFLKLVAVHQSETVGQYLAEIVVILIPLLPEDDVNGQPTLDKPAKLAVSILEWLTDEELGRQLAPFFVKVPFLPSSSSLNSVRSSLRRNGVDVDSLQIATQSTQHDSSTGSRDTCTTIGGSVGHGSGNSKKRTALQKRLAMLFPLLSHENTNVRCVAMKHLSDLLRGNRSSFHELVLRERDASIKCFLTVVSDIGNSSGTVTALMEALLARSTVESDPEGIILLAECIGEVGALDINYLEDGMTIASKRQMGHVDYNYKWRADNTPWRSKRSQYELHIVTNHLVHSLKAAPTSGDQNKIAFCIQQLLVHLDESVRERNAPTKRDGTNRDCMSELLKSKLCDAGVVDAVEPFWYSEFKEVEHTNQMKQPPYFEKSSTFFSWISNWCRQMIYRSNEVQSPWSKLFYSCRTAVRTTAGLSTAEFLLPILVLDRLCFGNAQDEKFVFGEMCSTLTVSDNEFGAMDGTERQKAVNAVLTIIDVLQSWAEEETEKRHLNSRRNVPGSGTSVESIIPESWPLDESIMRIEDMLQALPLSLRARAASSIGMNARSLRLLELLARASVADNVFNVSDTKNDDSEWKWHRSRAAGVCPKDNVDLLNTVLAELQDYESMRALGHFISDPMSSIRENIRFKEASGDWIGALQDYERAQQLNPTSPDGHHLKCGMLRCLSELGQYESILNQVHGILYQASSATSTSSELTVNLSLPIGIEAAWCLGRWETLSELASLGNDGHTEPDSRFKHSVGQVMLGIHRKDFNAVKLNVRKARFSLMTLLSSSASESYTRAYEHVVKLQSLTEVEDASLVLCNEPKVDLGELSVRLGWQRRMDFVSSSGMQSIVKSRLALSRLASDDLLEGELFLSLGKRARKNGMYSTSSMCFAQAEASLTCTAADKRSICRLSALQIQEAKLKHALGESSGALKILSYDDLERFAGLDRNGLLVEVLQRMSIHSKAIDSQANSDDELIGTFVRGALQSTLWMIEGGLKSNSQVINRFHVVLKLAPKWEKGHFQFAKFLESLLEARISALRKRLPQANPGVHESCARNRVVDKVCHRHILRAMKHYAEALILDTKHVYQALPRLLSLWFDFTSSGGIDSIPELSLLSTGPCFKSSDDITSFVSEANIFMARNFKLIPVIAFYTAIPQLLSRVTHDDKDTSTVVRGILKRILTKFPAQALWQLGWVRMSRFNERREIGEEIFAEAEKALSDAVTDDVARTDNTRKISNSHKILVASRSLFLHLLKLAQLKPSDPHAESVNVAPWKGEAELSDFIPPVQAALSASLAAGCHASEHFPRNVPRMQCFSPKVYVLASKARPKRLKALAISSYSNSPKSCTSNIGEYHFLVKFEAKGDLRKDARVQDLNNVINRMLSYSSTLGGSHSGHRRPHLRTFIVTCLSEDTGLLEWVPDTQSLRSLVNKSYNPQAAPFSSKRRGRRTTNFGDHVLRSNFDKSQDMFFKSANPKRAAAMFEELCLKAYPPVLFWWFIQHFADPHSWYEARMRFTLSCAAWSGVGHVIGLGDRHSENILVDTSNGACVHVDFDCIFDKGLNLPKPEVIPFRLTQNMLDAFGPTGADGVYAASLRLVMKRLRENRDTLLSVLEPFVNDPIIDWKRYRSQQHQKQSKSSTSATEKEDRQTREAKRSVQVIDERLQGIYNLVNPNLKKLASAMIASGSCSSDDNDDDDLQHMVPLSVDGQVHKMISEATSAENLVQQYVGWMPWV